MCTQNSIKNIPQASRYRTSFTFSQFGPRQRLVYPGQMLSIPKCIQTPYRSRDTASFTFFRIWTSAKHRPTDKWHLAIHWARSWQYQYVRKFLSNYSLWFKSYKCAIFANWSRTNWPRTDIYLETLKTLRFTSTVSLTGLTWCCFLFNSLYWHVISNN